MTSGRVLDRLTMNIPALVGGSGDLTPANNTLVNGFRAVTRDDFCGRYLHFGIREHAMAAAMNGIALHRGFIPYGGSFLVFTDYLRPALRLGALMRQRTIHVMTHDSIGLGQDGPTHQPVEHLASLRAMPNLLLLRPADPVEVAECWALALCHMDGPTVLALSRQDVRLLRRETWSENLSARDGYVMAGAIQTHTATLLATGTEVGLAMEARDGRQRRSIGTWVASKPSWSLFEAQPAEYRAEVLGTTPLRVAVEAAAQLGWDRYIGEHGSFVGLRDFCASAPADVLYEMFGVSVEGRVEAVERLMSGPLWCSSKRQLGKERAFFGHLNLQRRSRRCNKPVRS